MAGDEIGHNLTSTSLSIQDRNRLDAAMKDKLGDNVCGVLKLKPSDKEAASRVWRRKHPKISDRKLGPAGMRALRGRLSRMGGEARQSVRSGMLAKRQDQRIDDALARLDRAAQEKDPKDPSGRYGIAQLGKSKHVRVRTNLQRAILQRDRRKLLSALKLSVEKDYSKEFHLHGLARKDIENNRSLTPKTRKAKLKKLDAKFIDENSETIALLEQLTDVIDLQIARIRNAKELDPNFDDHGMLDELQDAQESLESLLDALSPRPQRSGNSNFPTTDAFVKVMKDLQKAWGPEELKITKDLGSAAAIRDAARGRSAAQQRQIRNDRAFVGKSDVVTLSQGVIVGPQSQTSKRDLYEAGLCKRLETHGLANEFENEAISYKYKAVEHLSDQIQKSGIGDFNVTPTTANPDAPDRIGNRMLLDRHNDRLFYHRHRTRLEARIDAGVNKAKRLAKTISNQAKLIGLNEELLKRKRKQLHNPKPRSGDDKPQSKAGDLKINDDLKKDNDLEKDNDFERDDIRKTDDNVVEIKIDDVPGDAPSERKIDIAQLGDDASIEDLKAEIIDIENTIINAKSKLAQLKDDLAETVGGIAADRERLIGLDETQQAKTVAKYFREDKTKPPKLSSVTAEFNSAFDAVRQDVEACTDGGSSPEAQAIRTALEKASACADDVGQITLKGRGMNFSASVAEIDAVADKWKTQVALEKDLRQLQRLELNVARAKKEFRNRGLVSGWLHRLSFWTGFGGAYRRWANANDALKSARKTAFERFSTHVQFDDDKKLQEAFSNFMNYGFIGSGPWTSDLSAAGKTVASGLEAVMMANEYLEARAEDAGNAGKDAIEALLKNDSAKGGFFAEGTSEFLEKLLNGIEHVEHGAGAIGSMTSVVNAQIKINEKKRKKRMGEKLISDFDAAKQKKKNNLDREHYAIRHGVSRMLGMRLSGQRIGSLRFEQLTGSGHASRHVIASAARFVRPDYAAHAYTAHLLGQVGIGGAVVFEAGETVASLVEATHGRVESNKLEKKYQEKKREFLAENKSALGLQTKTEKELSKMSRDDIGKKVDEREEQLRAQISTLKTQSGVNKQQIHALRAEIQNRRKTFDNLSNLREFVTTLRERKKVNEKFVVFVKGLVATGGYSTSFAVSFSAGAATLSPVVAAGALGIAGAGAVCVKIYRSKKASNIERRAQMADKALTDMAQPGMIKEIQKKAKKHHVSAETIAWEMLMMKDPEYKAELLLADLNQEAGRLRMTDAQINRKGMLENRKAQHLKEDIDLATRLEKATRSAQAAERKAGRYGLWISTVDRNDRTVDMTARKNRLDKARDDAVKKRDNLRAQLESHRKQRLYIQDPDNVDQKIDVDAELQRIDRDRSALFNKNSPNHSKTALILRDVVGMSQTEILAMIDAGDTRDDEHAVELSRALIVSHLDEE